MRRPRCSFKIHAASRFAKAGQPEDHVFLFVAADNLEGAYRAGHDILGDAA